MTGAEYLQSLKMAERPSGKMTGAEYLQSRELKGSQPEVRRTVKPTRTGMPSVGGYQPLVKAAPPATVDDLLKEDKEIPWGLTIKAALGKTGESLRDALFEIGRGASQWSGSPKTPSAKERLPHPVTAIEGALRPMQSFGQNAVAGGIELTPYLVPYAGQGLFATDMASAIGDDPHAAVEMGKDIGRSFAAPFSEEGRERLRQAPVENAMNIALPLALLIGGGKKIMSKGPKVKPPVTVADLLAEEPIPGARPAGETKPTVKAKPKPKAEVEQKPVSRKLTAEEEAARAYDEINLSDVEVWEPAKRPAKPSKKAVFEEQAVESIKKEFPGMTDQEAMRVHRSRLKSTKSDYGDVYAGKKAEAKPSLFESEVVQEAPVKPVVKEAAKLPDDQAKQLDKAGVAKPVTVESETPALDAARDLAHTKLADKKNPYLSMPIERVRQDAGSGVLLAQEALGVREGKTPAAAPKAVPKVEAKPAEVAKPEKVVADKTTATEAPAKQHYEMTFKEYLESYPEELRKSGKQVNKIRNAHRSVVEAAYYAGDKIPENILRENPKLWEKIKNSYSGEKRQPAKVVKPEKVVADKTAAIEAPAFKKGQKVTIQLPKHKKPVKAQIKNIATDDAGKPVKFMVEYPGTTMRGKRRVSTTFTDVVTPDQMAPLKSSAGAAAYHEALRRVPKEKRAQARKDAKALDDLLFDNADRFMTEAEADAIYGKITNSGEKQQTLARGEMIATARERAARELGLPDLHDPVNRANALKKVKGFIDSGKTVREVVEAGAQPKGTEQKFIGDLDLKVGDEVMSGGEWLRVIDHKNGELTIKDGRTFKINDEWANIPIDVDRKGQAIIDRKVSVEKTNVTKWDTVEGTPEMIPRRATPEELAGEALTNLAEPGRKKPTSKDVGHPSPAETGEGMELGAFSTPESWKALGYSAQKAFRKVTGKDGKAVPEPAADNQPIVSREHAVRTAKTRMAQLQAEKYTPAVSDSKYTEMARDIIYKKDIGKFESGSKDFYRNTVKVFGDKGWAEEHVIRPWEDAKHGYVRFEKTLRDEHARVIEGQYGIKPWSKADRAVMDFGEGKRDLNSLIKQFGEKKARKIMKAAEWYREKYDMLLEEYNEVMRMIYPTDPNKIVKNRRDYFHHFSDMSGFGSLLKVFDTPAGIPSELVGISDFTRPKSRFADFAQRRFGMESERSAAGGFSRYVGKAAYGIHIDPLIAQFRGFEKALREATGTPGHSKAELVELKRQVAKEQGVTLLERKDGVLVAPKGTGEAIAARIKEVTAKQRQSAQGTGHLNNYIEFLTDYTNSLAGKSNPVDRVVQKFIPGGRKTTSLVYWLNGRIKQNTVVGNAKSALSQFFNIPQAMGVVQHHAVAGLYRTLSDAMMATVWGKKGARYKINTPMHKSRFLLERYKRSPYDRFENAWFARKIGVRYQPRVKQTAAWMLQVGDEVSTRWIWNSMYEKALADKVGDPIRWADRQTRNMVGGRGLGEVPLLQESKFVQVFAPFTLEVGNAIWCMQDMMKGGNYRGLAVMALTSYFMNNIVEDITGDRVSFDPIDAAIAAANVVANDELSATQKVIRGGGRMAGEMISNLPGGQQLAAMYPEAGVKIGGERLSRKELFGRNDPTRYGTGLAITKGVTDPVFKVVFPFGGGQAKKTIQGAEALQEGRVISGSGKKELYDMPADAGTAARALLFGKYSTPQAREYFDKRESSRTGDKQKNVLEKRSAANRDARAYVKLGKYDEAQKIINEWNATHTALTLRLPSLERMKKEAGQSVKKAERTQKRREQLLQSFQPGQ